LSGHQVLVTGGAEVYNIGSGKAYSVNEIFSMLRRCLGKERIRANYLPAESGKIGGSIADIKKKTVQLVFNPKVSVEEGIRLALQRGGAYAGK